jgi:hypothetical protein
MNIIDVTAPIKIEELKKYFVDKDTFFVVDYENSTLQGSKLLTYLSNLDIPCDIKFGSMDQLAEMLEYYLDSTFIVTLSSLEKAAISLLLQHKGVDEIVNQDLLDRFKDKLDQWTNKLESLALYNLYMINEESFKSWITEQHEEDSTSSLVGVNFLSLLKHPEFYIFYEKMITVPKYYSCYFNEYIFKGQNLYSFWANENNPMFLLTWGISEGITDHEKYLHPDYDKELTEENL